MAPHANDSDTSGYTPSIDSIEELRRKLELSGYISGTKQSWITREPRTIDSHDREEDYKPWVLQLSLGDIQEIDDAFVYFEGTKLPLNKLQAAEFPLPNLSLRIRESAVLLTGDQPYFLIRGLRPSWFSKYKNIVIYTGIASHVGTKRAVAANDPTALHHITNIEDPDGTQKTYRGPANRTKALPFHTDYGEILSLYTLSRPASGGDFYLADIHDIEAKIQSIRPDIVDKLHKPWRMVNAKEEGAYDERPLLFNLASGKLATQISRARLFGTADMHRPKSLPPLTPEQVEALDAVHATGQDVARRFQFRSGDIFFFNNMRLLHARDSYMDGNEEENTTRRYLLRLILKDERNRDGWEIPIELKETWKELYDHDDESELFPIYEERFSYKASH